jgi:hypothetical protein
MIDDGGPAYPTTKDCWGGTGICPEGMSLRDWYAGLAMAQEMIMEPSEPAERIAEWAFERADAMIAHRRKGNGG